MTFADELSAFHLAVTSGHAVEVSDWALGSASLPAADRLGIYRHAYRTRLVGTLRDLFPRVVAQVGPSFDDLAWGWLLAHPPTERSLFHLGGALPAALPSPLAAAALLDDARRRVFDEADDEPLTVDALRALAPEAWASLRLRRTRASRLLVLDHAVTEIPAEVTPVPGGWHVLVWRQGSSAVVHHRPLDPVETVLAEGLGQVVALETIAERVAEAGGADAVAALTLAFGRAATEGWVTLA